MTVVNLIAKGLICVGILFSLLNWLCLFGSLCKRRFVSPAFPAPSLLTTLGLALMESTRSYCWLGLFTDYTLFAMMAAATRLIAEVWHTSSFTRQALLAAVDGPRHFMLSLHRGGYFLLRGTFDAGVPCGVKGGCISSFNVAGRWEKISDGRLRLGSYYGERALTLVPEGTGYAASEANYPTDRRFLYDRLDGLRFHRDG
jgi:hypothetical protein